MTATGERSSSASTGATAASASSSQAMAISNTWWAVGHALFLVEALLYTLFPSLPIFYRLALLGLVASYATDVYRVYASAPSHKSLAETLLLSDRTPYLVLVILLYMLKPAPVLLIPLSIYSLFSVLQHARSDKRIYEQPWWRAYCLVPGEQLLTYHQAALAVGSQLEVLAAPWLLLSAWRVGIVLPLAYVSYLRWQYYVNPRQRAVYAAWDQMLVRITEHPSCPRSVRKAYAVLQGSLKKWTRLQPAVVPPARPSQGVRTGVNRRSD